MKKFAVILFILLPLTVAAYIFIFPDRIVSERENRNLMTWNSLSKNITEGQFQSDFESYLSDQFPFKDKLIFVQTGLRIAAGQKDIGGAYICDGDRLVQKITDSDINKKSLISFADKVNNLAKSNKVYVMYVPSAEISLKSLLPAGAPVYNYDALYTQLCDRLCNAKMIDLKDSLQSADCYYKTDHHWNAYGAYTAYAAFCRAKGETPKSIESFGLKTVTGDFRGTLFSKIPAVKTADEILLPQTCDLIVTADGAKVDFYDMSALEITDKYRVFQGGNHGICEIVSKSSQSGKTLLILKDSFANSFVPFIVGDYSKIILLDDRYTFLSLEDYVKMTDPDEILVLREMIN